MIEMTVVTVDQITKTFGNHHVLDNVSFTLTRGNCIALIGPNGAGKTTMLRILTGLIKPTSGKCYYKRSTKDIRSLIGYLPQHPVFHEWMTGKEFLQYSAMLTEMPKKTAQQRAEKLLKVVGIDEAKHHRIHTYSGGMKQRLGIAQAIIHQPSLLILDEPVSALDPIGRREILDLLSTLKKDMTILFSTHILSDADEVSDDLILLNHGKVLEADSMMNLRATYQTAMIEVSLQGDLGQYEQALLQLDTVVEIHIIRDMLHVSVTDIEAARSEILNKAVAENWPLTSFAINRASLEEMFMKAVKN